MSDAKFQELVQPILEKKYSTSSSCFNYDNLRRDFSYIDEIVEGVYRVMQGAPEKKNGEDGIQIPPYAVYNIGDCQMEILRTYPKIGNNVV